MKIFCTKLALLMAIVGIVLPGCYRQPEASPSTLTTLHQGNLRIPDHADAPKLVYVDARDISSHAPHLKDHLAAALAKGRYKVASSPSKAGYILHVQILKDGYVDTDSLKAAVKAGYGKKSNLKGRETKALLVDALMVQRRIPSAKRPSRQQMKNISSRNALGSSQMRLAVFSPANKSSPEDFSRAIAQELALRMEKSR